KVSFNPREKENRFKNWSTQLNGFKQRSQKLDSLLELILEEISELGFWSKKEIVKKKGSGVGILIRNDWGKHLGHL
ncbi:19782_t:CDS:2, partial [Gigaspora rosea]